MEKYQNLVPDYNAIIGHQAAIAMNLLDGQIDLQKDDLWMRIFEMTEVLNEAGTQIEDLFPVLSEPVR